MASWGVLGFLGTLWAVGGSRDSHGARLGGLLGVLGRLFGGFWKIMRLQVGAMLVPKMDKKWVRKSIEIQMILGTLLFKIFCPFLEHSGG